MILIKENKLKKRSVFYDGKYYYKKWNFLNSVWMENHFNLLKQYEPNIPVGYSYDENSMTLIMNKIEGTLANEFEPTRAFINKIYKSCLFNIESTMPYAHGDWVLSNMIISSEGTVKFIDWDNLSIMSKNDALKKLHSDLNSAFVNKFEEYLNDSKSI